MNARGWMSRHGAVWFLSGWLFLIPPVNDPSAPVASWFQEQAFDTARECEAFRHSPPKPYPDKLLDVWMKGRCVPAEFIYPSPTPPKRPAK